MACFLSKKSENKMTLKKCTFTQYIFFGEIKIGKLYKYIDLYLGK